MFNNLRNKEMKLLSWKEVHRLRDNPSQVEFEVFESKFSVRSTRIPSSSNVHRSDTLASYGSVMEILNLIPSN